MSLILPTFFPRSTFDMDLWHRPFLHGLSTLDMFDPFDDLDLAMSRNLHWINEPFERVFAQPRVPKKYRLAVDCPGFSAKSIKTEIKDNVLYVTGSEGQKEHEGDYSMREFRKSFKLPPNIEPEKMASFVTSNGKCIIEIPLKQDEKQVSIANGFDLMPRIVDDADGSKQVQMKVPIPAGIDPSQVSVTCKDRDLIIKAENKEENGDRSSQSYYYQRVTLPENTDFDALKCTLDDKSRLLSIKAPVNQELTRNYRQIPIENRRN